MGRALTSLCVAAAVGACAPAATGRPGESRFGATDEVVVLPLGDAVRPPIHPVTPRHPDDVREEDAGAAAAAFVVDTAGIIEPRTISFVVTNARRAYLRSVCDALRAARFAPVAVDGRPRRALLLAGYGFSRSRYLPRPTQLPPLDSIAAALRALPRDSLFATLRRAPHCP